MKWHRINGDILVIRPNSILFAVNSNRKHPIFIPKVCLVEFNEHIYDSDDDLSGVDIKVKDWYYKARREEFDV